MKRETWVDKNGELVYIKHNRKPIILLTKMELNATTCLLSGTVTKMGKVFIAPFKRIS